MLGVDGFVYTAYRRSCFANAAVNEGVVKNSQYFTGKQNSHVACTTDANSIFVINFEKTDDVLKVLKNDRKSSDAGSQGRALKHRGNGDRPQTFYLSILLIFYV